MTKRAFSLAETLTALGIIGILCVTMLSLNSMSDNKYKVATTKLFQVDSALKSWGKAISKSNETGLGATSVITSQKSLNDSLLDYFANLSNTSGNELTTSKNNSYGSSSNEIILNNGVKLTLAYNDKSGFSGDNYVKNESSSPLAVVTAEIKDLPNTKEEYILKANGLYDLASIYEGYKEISVKTIEIDDGKGGKTEKKVFCLDETLCGEAKGGCEKNLSACLAAPDDGETIYTKKDTTSIASCGYNTTGTILTTEISTAYGVYTTTLNTCCNAPRFYAGKENNVNVCECDFTKFTPQAGYVKADSEASCQIIVEKGKYAISGEDYLCTTGHFCPNEGMTAPIICPKGSYCPNYSDNTDKNKNDKYHPSVFADENNILDGGLIDKVPCPKGHYCPDEGMTSAIKCPKGTYCPDEGMVAPIKCPTGTYGDKEGAETKGDACKPCPKMYYCPNTGMTDIDLPNFECLAEHGKYSAEGVTACSVCPAGQYLDQTELKCKPCAKGHYSANAGAIACDLCPTGTIQPEEGKSFCTSCSTGVSTDDRLICGCPAGEYLDMKAKACKPCSVGTYGDEAGLIDACKPCPIGQYQNETGKKECKICSANTYQNEEGQSSCKSCPNNSTSEENSASIDACKCDAGFYMNSNKTECVICPVGTHKGDMEAGATDVSSCKLCPAGTMGQLRYACYFYGNTGECTQCTGMKSATQCLSEAGITTKGNVFLYEGKVTTYAVKKLIEQGIIFEPYCAPCSTGKYQNEEGKTSCKNCAAGQYQDEVGQSECKLCPLGQYQYDTGKTECIPCPCGKYQDEEGQSSCKTCNAETYQPNKGQSGCLIPDEGMTPTPGKCDYQKKCPTLTYNNITYDMIATKTSCDCPKMHNAGPWPWCWDATGYTAVKSNGDGEYTCTATYQICEPLILDLKGSDCGQDGKCISNPEKTDCCSLKGIKMTSLEDGVIFDLDGDGKKDLISWTDYQTEFDDAFLVYDKNGNGQIDDGRELFGDQNGASDGFSELAKYDDNKDGKITTEDKIFDELQLWVDLNKNGVVDYNLFKQTKELKKLNDVGIIELSTKGDINYDENGIVKQDEHGNTFGLIGSFKRIVENGIEVIGEMVDVFFKMIHSIFEK